VIGARWTIFGRSGHLRIQTPNTEFRFDGFPYSDFDKVRDIMNEYYDVETNKLPMSTAGNSFGLTEIEDRNLAFKQCILEDADEEGEEFEPREGDEMMSMKLAEVSQCVLPGNNRNEIELQFHESDTVEAGTDQLVAIRFYIPPDPEMDPSDRDAPTSAEVFHQRIMKNAKIKNTAGDVIVEFDENKGTFLTPRGRYLIELYDSFLRMRGNKYDYKIKYDDIARLFLLPKPDDTHMAFVIALDKPIRQGQQRYQMLVLQTTKENSEVTVNLDEKELEEEYKGELQPVMQGALCNLIAKTFKIIAKKKVFIPGKFVNAYQQSCVKCALKANEGHLYPLEKSFVFIHKPPVLIRFDEVDSVEFQRYAGGQGSTRNFDLCVMLASSAGDPQKEYIFSGIDRSDYTSLYNFLSGKKIKIKNIQESKIDTAPSAPLYNEMDYGPPGEGEESSEDEDYGSADDESQSSESDHDDDNLEVDEDDSDLEDARKKAGSSTTNTPIKKKKRKESSSGSSMKDKDRKRKKVAAAAPVSSEKKKAPPAKTKKDPNAPKKAMTAFMYFSTGIRPEVKEENPELSFGDIAKTIGKRFKSLTSEEKQKWEAMAQVDKKRYVKAMESYTPPPKDLSSSSPKGKKGAGKKKKDPNAPKRPMTSYMLLSVAIRPTLKEENPDASFGELAKLVSARYKAMTPEEIEKWNKKAAIAKEKYQVEMKKYKEKQQQAAVKEESSQDEDDSDSSESEDKASDSNDDSDSDSD